MPARTGCCNKNYVNVQKMNVNTGRIIWRAHVPTPSPYVQNTRIVALSDGSFVIRSWEGYLTRISADGSTVLYSTSITAVTGEAAPFQSYMAVSGSDLTAVATKTGGSGTGTISVYDNTLSLQWSHSGFTNTPGIAWKGGVFYAAWTGTSPYYITGYTDSSGATASTTTWTAANINEASPIWCSDSTGIYSAPSSPSALVNSYQLRYAGAGAYSGTTTGSGLCASGPMCPSLSTGNTFGCFYSGSLIAPNQVGKFNWGTFANTWASNIGTYPTIFGSVGLGVPYCLAALNDGGVVVGGANMAFPACDFDPRTDPTMELKNVVCFNSDGTLRWTSRQSDELTNHIARPHNGIDGAKYSVAIGADDGNPVFVSDSFLNAAKIIPYCYYGSGGPCNGATCSFKTLPAALGGYQWSPLTSCSVCNCPYNATTLTAAYGAPTFPTEKATFYCQ